MDGSFNDGGLRVTGYELRLLIIILVGFAHVLAHTPPNARTIEF